MNILEFEKKGSRWECEISPSGEATVQVNRAERGEFTVYARISDEGGANKWVSVYNEPSVGNRRDILQTIDIPAGVDVLLVSWTEVTSAYAL